MSRIVRLDAGVARVPLHDVATTRRIESAALATLAASGELMARAGAATARLALALAPHARHVVVHAGPGNNGGDGFVAAVQLAAAGRRVVVRWHGDASRRPADAQAAFERARAAGVAMAEGLDAVGAPCDLVIDALLGIGVRARDPASNEDPYAAVIDHIAAARARGACVLAVDVPSGLDADRGRTALARAVEADHTLTLLTVKPGLFTAEGRDHAGCTWWCDLGVPLDAEPVSAVFCGTASIRHQAPRASAHKGTQGNVVVVGGAPGMAGAALLAARAALAAGAGRVWVDRIAGSTPDAAPVDPMQPELMTRTGWWRGTPATLQGTTVICGCGGGDAVAATLPTLLAHATRLVLDADALNAMAGDASLFARLAARAAHGLATVLTPHPLEAARLLGTDTRAVQGDRLDAARELAGRAQAAVVLKGSGSIVAAPGVTPVIVATGNASLATAGTGDVLAGWTGGRWRPGRAAFDVARDAAIEHGAAALPPADAPLLASALIRRLGQRPRPPRGQGPA